LKKNNEVIGFIDLTYGIESQYVFISYIAISKEKSKDDEILFTGIFIELLFDFLLKQHYIIKGILFEIEGDVRLRLFKRALKTQKYYLYLVDIDYYQLSMPCDGEAGSTSRKPMNLIFVSHERRKNGLEKQELLTMLRFIFFQIYVDLTDDDEDEYIKILNGYYDEYVEKLPDIIPLK
jgi:hypothetical protein